MNNISRKNHIQFLRAFSVMLVIFYHLKFEFFSKGYLGVDIFFVISGYVITQRIYKDYLSYGKVLIKDFFIRRFKRIFPVLIFVVISVLLIFLVFGPPDLALKTMNGALYSVLGISNIYFWKKERDYFDTVFDNPFGHTWSLGIEEQFYLIYPLILYVLFVIIKKNKEIIISRIFLIVFILLVSFSIYLSGNNPNLVFYFPIFRFWEFLAGCILFLITKDSDKKNSLLFLLFTTLTVLLLFSKIPIPYLFNNILIVIFSSFIILLYKENTALNIIFENKILTYIGNISYSLYLWHLPVIFFMGIYFNEIYKNILSLPIIIFLSIFSFHFIENKFRYINLNLNFNLKTKVFLIIFVTFFITLVSLFVKTVNNRSYVNDTKLLVMNFLLKFNYLENKLNFTDRTVAYKFNINGNSIYRFCTKKSKEFKLNSQNLRIECLKNKNQKTLIYIEGNSRTAGFIPMFNYSSVVENFYYDHSTNVLTDETTFEETPFEKINSLLNNFENVIYATSINNLNEMDLLKNILEKFHKKIKILILGTVPVVDDKINPLKCFVKQKDCYYFTNEDIKKRNLYKYFESMNDLMTKDKRIFFYNPYKVLCPKNKCYVYEKTNDILTHRDLFHLTREGSKLLTENFNNFFKVNF